MTASPPPVLPRSRWVLPAPADAGTSAALAAELRLPEPICRLLAVRGLGDPEVARRYLRPRLEQLHDPMLMGGMDRAVERLVTAIRGGETILVHGDYDVDGICSTTLLTRALRRMGATVVPFIPRRLVDGYDLTMAGVEAARRAGARVVVTCDCGTSAREPVRALCESGIDVIVSDHHLPGGALPDCLAVLNPRRPGCEYPDKDLAAVGVAFKLALAVARAMGESENPIYGMLDLVALATIADIAPLRGENRVLARYGLRLMAETRNVGLRALIRASGLEHKALTAGRIGFILAPRLNAVGRLDHALRGVQLLTTEDESEANRIARELEELNQQRQEIDRRTLVEARKQVETLDLDATWGLVLAQEGWHPGVIGIVASRVVEEFCRPTLMVAIHDGVGKGSGRSIPAFDLHAGLGECRDLLLRFGGHRAAAGITIERDRIPDLAERFNAVVRSRLVEDDLAPVVRVDLEVPLAAVNDDLETLLRHFEPFGVGNAAPVFMVRGARLQGAPRIVGREGDGLRLRLADGTASLDALGWGMGSLAPSLAAGAQVDVAFRLERDEWNGHSRLQARLAGVRI